jgi:hypothetical protein
MVRIGIRDIAMILSTLPESTTNKYTLPLRDCLIDSLLEEKYFNGIDDKFYDRII